MTKCVSFQHFSAPTWLQRWSGWCLWWVRNFLFRLNAMSITPTPSCPSYRVSHSPLLWHPPLSVCITSLHVAFLPVHSHLPPHFLWDPGHLQTASLYGLLPRGESPPPETIKGLGESSAQSAERQPRGGPAEGERRSQSPAGGGQGLHWLRVMLFCFRKLLAM